MTITFEQRVRVPSTVLASTVGEETVLLNLVSESYYGLDHVGTRMWQEASSGQTLSDVRDRLVSEFEVDPGTLGADLLALLNELMTKGLVEPCL